MVRLQRPHLPLPYVHAPSIQLESFKHYQQAPLSGGENLTRRLYKFTDTKLDVEFFTKGTTTPVSSFTRVQQLPLHLVF